MSLLNVCRYTVLLTVPFEYNYLFKTNLKCKKNKEIFPPLFSAAPEAYGSSWGQGSNPNLICDLHQILNPLRYIQQENRRWLILLCASIKETKLLKKKETFGDH